jgi:hypothetical protein
VALPLPGGRAGAFSRGPGFEVRLPIGRLEVGLRPSVAPLLGVGGAEVGSLGAIGLEAVGKLCGLQRLVKSGVVCRDLLQFIMFSN